MNKNVGLERGERVAAGRDFLRVAQGITQGSKRESLIKPGDRLSNVPVVIFEGWHRAIQLSPAEEGLTGTTNVEVAEIVKRSNIAGLTKVVLKSDQDAPGTVRRPVSAGGFSSYKAPYWWQGNL